MICGPAPGEASSQTETTDMRVKLGFLGTLFASLCCLGVSVVIAPANRYRPGFSNQRSYTPALGTAFLTHYPLGAAQRGGSDMMTDGHCFWVFSQGFC